MSLYKDDGDVVIHTGEAQKLGAFLISICYRRLLRIQCASIRDNFFLNFNVVWRYLTNEADEMALLACLCYTMNSEDEFFIIWTSCC